MLMTEAHLARRNGIFMPQPYRQHKVKKSMGAIKTVLGERKRQKISEFNARRQQQQQQEELLDAETAMMQEADRLDLDDDDDMDIGNGEDSSDADPKNKD